MDSESQVIHQQMEDTRTSLQDKLETLEQHVTDTMHNATEAVADTVDSVKGAVQDTVDSVKDTFDVRQHVERHPWTMFLGAALVGFVGARLLNRALAPRRPTLASPPHEPAPAVSRNGHTIAVNGAAPAAASPFAATRTLWNVVADEYSEELGKLKGLAVSTAGGILREMIAESVPPALSDQVKELVDGVTVKLGGHLLEGAIWSASPRPAKQEGERPGASHADLHRLADDGCPLSAPEAEPKGARLDGTAASPLEAALKERAGLLARPDHE